MFLKKFDLTKEVYIEANNLDYLTKLVLIQKAYYDQTKLCLVYSKSADLLFMQIKPEAFLKTFPRLLKNKIVMALVGYNKLFTATAKQVAVEQGIYKHLDNLKNLAILCNRKEKELVCYPVEFYSISIYTELKLGTAYISLKKKSTLQELFRHLINQNFYKIKEELQKELKILEK